MEMLFGIAVNDASLCAAFIEETGAWYEELAQLKGGQLGLGFHGSGEMLTRKQPIFGRGAERILVEQIAARQAVVWASSQRPTSLELGAPLRYRDWLFAAGGLDSLGDEFVERTRTELASFAFAGGRTTSPAEAVMMVFMDALHRRNLLDVSEFTTDSLWSTFNTAWLRVRELAGPSVPALAVILHRHGQMFALSLGRELRVRSLEGLGGGGRRRAAMHGHFRGLVVSDQWSEAGVLVASGCEVGRDARPRMVELGSSTPRAGRA